jgi:hypothetical protein
MSLSTDRGAHYFHTPEKGGELDRGHPTAGRAHTAGRSMASGKPCRGFGCARRRRSNRGKTA